MIADGHPEDAPFFHPQLAAVKHDHRTQDGQVIRPVIVIEGYPNRRPPNLCDLAKSAQA
jgi:hypothetical protein